MSNQARVNEHDFMRMFGLGRDELPTAFLERIREADTTWRTPTQAELEAYILDVVHRIHESGQARIPEENQEAFERGWRENFDAALEQCITPDALRPRYFRDNKYLRYNKTLIVTDNLNLEYELFTLARLLIFPKYLSPYPWVYEFGCGSCSNLLMLSDLFPDKRLCGLDWAPASVDIANLLAERMGRHIHGELFDMLNPPADFELEPESAVLTVHALEQLGERHEPWIEFLLRVRPAIVVNYEPILEFYDAANLWDYLALLYSRKRGYLSGYYTALQRLAKAGRVEILEARRSYFGGEMHEAYSLIVWRPL